MAKRKKTESRRIDTGGGTYVEGSVKVEGGDFVGRDKVTVTRTGVEPDEVALAFRRFYEAVEARPDTSPQDKADMRVELEELEAEVAKDEAADEGFIARRLRNIGRMAPDILEVVLTTFANPAAGLGLVAKKVAERMRAEAEGTAA